MASILHPMVLVFDLNGTLLDNRAVQPALRSIFGRKLSSEEYFTRVLEYCMAVTLTGQYRSFSDIALAVLGMEADARRVTLTEGSTKRVAADLKSLPAFCDVKHSLRRLRKANFRLAVLTNSASEDAREQLNSAGLGEYFDTVLSVAEVRRFKPSPEPYALAANSLGVQPYEILLVAAHPWDLMGAAAAGCRTAFIQRPGKALFPGALKPTYVARDLNDLVAQLSSASGQSKWRVVPALAAVSALSALALLAGSMRSRASHN
ncbi:MAG: haloacid dehalogenase type II [Bryobacteraceae bacterium]